MDFIFCSEDEYEKGSLLQGDLLVRNSTLRDVLAQAHDYYANAPDYTHFLVLTQSCDLVRRSGKNPKSRYITLAAARPVSLVIDRFLERLSFPPLNLPIVLCDKEKEVFAKQFLENLLHNTADGYFFIKRDSHPLLEEDLCVFLSLSVALRVAHYDDCLKAKIGQLDDVFAAKVGWLTGSLYSRVGTPDLEQKVRDSTSYKERFYDEALFNRSAWLTIEQYRALRELLRYWSALKPNLVLDEELARAALQHVPPANELIVERIVELLEAEGLVGQAGTARNVLLNDAALQTMLKRRT